MKVKQSLYSILSALIAIGSLLHLPSAEAEVSEVPFSYRGGHIICVPVSLNEKTASTFILDTGAGVSLLSDKLASKLNAQSCGNHSGRRMSGQTLHMKMAAIKEIKVAEHRQKSPKLAVWNTEDLFGHSKEFADVGGILSLNYFRTVPFTIDYKRKMIVVEDSVSLKKRIESGVKVPVKMDSKRDVELSVKIPMSMAKTPKLYAEVDTGSDSLILDLRYLKSINIRSAKIKRVVGKDETGHTFVRYFSKLPGNIWLKDSPSILQRTPAVMFQKIIHDGLIGDAFLKQRTVTFDLSHSQMIFSR